MKNKHSVLEAAHACRRRGWSVVPVPAGEKAPRIKGWQRLRLNENELEEFFDEDCNLGVLLGEPSKNLADTDLDCKEAVSLAPYFLPPTDRIHGRKSNPSSHYFYYTDKSIKPQKFSDPKGECLVEIRSTGQQTIIPPSRHPSGEILRWEANGRPARVSEHKLLRRAKRLAAASLVARHWPKKGARHEASLALTGMLLRAGRDDAHVELFLSRVAWAAGDEQWKARKNAILTTKNRIARGGTATGRPHLERILGKDVVDRVCEWLEIHRIDAPAFNAVATRPAWPAPLDSDAFYGLAGDIVRAIEPETEADPVALLVQLLAAIGNAVGRQPHFEIEGSAQRSNLFVLVVGRSAKARKGTAWAHVIKLLERVDLGWAQKCIASNLSSGEGVIWAVRDKVHKEDEANKGEATDSRETENEKRLLIVQSEYSSALRIQRREGNVLSAIVRQAWDSGKLRILTKNSPVETTGAHVSIIGHITIDELRRELNETDEANGYANRFLFVCAERSKLLPLGGRVDSQILNRFVRRLQKAKYYARKVYKVAFSTKAERLYRKCYPKLSAEVPGMLGAITARAEAQVLRLSLIYALLDCSDLIKTQHLRAALAVWRYCSHSARYIFGGSLGSRIADRILQALRRKRKGMSRTEIREVFQRNVDGDRIQRALDFLSQYRLATCSTKATDGRPREIWKAV